MPSTASAVTVSVTSFSRTLFFATCLLAAMFTRPATAQNKRQVHLEISASRMAGVETQQKWMQLLAKVGADRVRSSTARSSAKISVEERETTLGVVVKVRGAISGKKLILPGGSFTQRDINGIRDYLESLRLDGVETALADKKAFGLTSEQLVKLSESLSRPLKLKTKGADSLEIVLHIQSKISYPVNLDRSAKSSLITNGKFLDELNGVSLGTALAATLRPAGLVWQPVRKQGEDVKLNITKSTEAEEFWPIGWPAEGIPLEVAPSLFQKNELEIRQFPLDQVLVAIQAKAKLPMLFDYNSMARREIDLSKTNVTFVKKNVSYGYSLRKLLAKTKPPMSYEIRNDEAGKPFLWLSTASSAR